ncbi:hypothetical protein D9M72_447610 [compost metagenome]
MKAPAFDEYFAAGVDQIALAGYQDRRRMRFESCHLLGECRRCNNVIATDQLDVLTPGLGADSVPVGLGTAADGRGAEDAELRVAAVSVDDVRRSVN